MTNKSHIKEQDDLRETAAAWFLRQRDQESESFDPAAFIAWLDADPTHARAYQEIEAAWEAIGHHATTPEVVSARRDALQRLQQVSRQRWGLSRANRVVWGLGLVASLAVAFAVFWLIQTPVASIYQTAVGEQRVITLDDNSRISLDAMTRLQVDYHENARRIVLFEGQAHFDVARDVLRPFSVQAGDQTVVALGTQFNVEIMDEQVLVTLLEGRVEVTSSADEASGLIGASSTIIELPKPVQLVPGQQLVVASGGVREPVVEANLQRTVSWRQGKLMFEDEPLDAAVARVNRHSHIRVLLEGTAIHDIKVSGVFNAGDTDAFVEAIESLFPVKVIRSNPQTVILRDVEQTN